MGEREDAEREFERVFGKVQKSPEHDSSTSGSVHAPTQKLPGDSDVLGIRTDSDRFIFKTPIPERLPIEPPTAAKAATDPSANKGSDIPAQDAMTIALNVNVFANIPKAGEEKSGDLSNVAWSEATQIFVRKPGGASPPNNGPTFAISIPKESQKSGADPFNFLQSTKQNDASASNGRAPSSEPAPTAKFTRVLHVQDSVTLPQIAHSVSAPSPLMPSVDLSNGPTPAPPSANGPSDFTRIVRGSELRALQEKLAAESNAPPVPDQNAWATPPSGSLPAGMATQIWSASSTQTQRLGAQNPQPWALPNANLPHMPKPPELPVAQPSKVSQYLPLILLLNLLFLLAILLIVFFAVKK